MNTGLERTIGAPNARIAGGHVAGTVVLIVGALSVGLTACNGIAGEYLVGAIDAGPVADGADVPEGAADANAGPDSSFDDAITQADAVTSSGDATVGDGSPTADGGPSGSDAGLDVLDSQVETMDGTVEADAGGRDAASDHVAGDAAPDCGVLVTCGGACADLTSDDSNCGTCGNACSSGYGCYGGTCCLAGGICSSCDTGYPYFCAIPQKSCWTVRPDCSKNVVCSDGNVYGCAFGEGQYDCTLHTCLVGDAGTCATGIYEASGACSVPVAIAAGLSHTCTLLSGGQVACWGWNAGGQVGDGSENNAPKPVLVVGLSGVTAIVLGASQSYALMSGGTLSTWGWGSTVVTTVSGINGITALASGLGYACALVSGGTMECWGGNADGELGDGTTTTRSTPEVVPGITGVTGIAARWDNTWAVTAGGALEAWGNNNNGQLGDGTTVGRSVPAALAGLAGVVAVAPSASGDHTCALKADGTVDCWGNNLYGQLGNGTTTNQLTPGAVSGLTGVTEVSCGLSHCCALITNGTVACWGGNFDGELGNGTLVNSSVPVTVSNVSGATAIAATDISTCAIVSGTVECWGNNDDGELGNGTTTGSSTPVPVTW